MPCTYKMTLGGQETTFNSEKSLRDYLEANKEKFMPKPVEDMSFEDQRDQFIDRWKLSPTVRFGEAGYIMKGGNLPTLELAKKMSKQLTERSGSLYHKLNVQYNSTYGLIHISPAVNQFDQYQIQEDSTPDDSKSPQKRTFLEVPINFRLKPDQLSGFILSSATLRTDTYTHGGEYFNIDKKREGNALQIAKSLNTTIEGLKDRVQATGISKEALADFLAGKSTVKLSVYKVDRVIDPQQFINPNEDTTIGKLRGSKITQQHNLESRIKKESDPHAKQELYKELNRVKAQIKELNRPVNQSISYIKKTFEDDVEAYKNKATHTLPEIDYAARLFDGYDVLFKSLNLEPFGDEVKTAFQAHHEQIAQLKKELREAKDDESRKYIETKGNMVLGDEEGIFPIRDIASGSSIVLAMSTTQNNPLVRYIGGLTNFAVNRAKDKTNQKGEEIKNATHALIEWGKQAGVKGVNLYNYMLEEDEKGNPNGHFVIKYGQFYSDFGKMVRTGKNDRQQVGNLLKFLSENTQSIEKLDDEFKEEWNKIYNNVLQKLKDQAVEGQSFDEQAAINSATEQANKISYGINPENFIKIMTAYNKTGSLHELDANYIKNFLDRGAYYKFMRFTPKDKFLDKKFSYIDNLPRDHPQRAFYDLFSEMHYEVNDRMRVDNMATLRRNFIAEYRKDYKDEDQSLFDYLKQEIHDWTLHTLTESPRDNIKGIDPLTGEMTKSIPFYAMDGRIKPEDKSYNLGKVLGNLVTQFNKWDALSDIETDLLAAQHILKQTPTYEVNSFGTPVTVNGEPVLKTDTSTVYKQADYHILSILYGERMKKDGVGSNKYYSYKTKERIAELDNISKERELTAEEAEDYRKLKDSYTSPTVKKGTNALMAWTSMKNIGFNLFGGMAEIFQGTTSLYLRYGGKKGVWDTLFPSILKLMNPQDSAAKNKFENLQKMFHVVGDVNPNMEESKVKKVAYYTYAIARKVSNVSYLVAALKEQQIKDKDDKEHSLYDVMDFDASGKIVLPPNFDNPFYNPDGSYSDYKYKIGQIIGKDIKQNRDREADADPIQLDQHFWGRLLGQFKASWLFEGLATRFESEHAPLNDLDKATKGIYRSFWDLSKVYTGKANALGEEESRFSMPKSILKAMLNVVKYSTFGRLTKFGAKTDQQSQLDYEGAIRTVREVQAALFLYGLVMLVSGLASGDKDKNRKMGLTFLSNYFMRTQRDMSTYFDPTSLSSIVSKNIIPSLSTVDQSWKLLEDPFRGVFGGNWYYNHGHANESLRISRDAADLVPAMNQVRMMLNKTKTQQSIFY